MARSRISGPKITFEFNEQVKHGGLLSSDLFLVCACRGGDVTANDSGKTEDIEVRLARDSSFSDLEERMKALEN